MTPNNLNVETRNYFRKHVCKYLKIRIRRRDEIEKALKWFLTFMLFMMAFSLLEMTVRTLFSMTYVHGNYTFSLTMVKWGLDVINLLLNLLSAYAFGYLAIGTIKMKNQDL